MNALLPKPRALAPLLVAGDVLCFVVFALLGQISHREPVTLWGSLRNALPLAVAWLAIGGVLGAFRPSAVRGPARAWWRVLGPWVPAGLVGLAARSLWLERPLLSTALAIFLVGNAALLVLWRTAFSIGLATRQPSGAKG
ncbi:hypothetical protein HRbin23_00847 [bacterium HR23]|nr:hypothetical protein HRbin23_00847 [bacterium HR23]